MNGKDKPVGARQPRTILENISLVLYTEEAAKGVL